MKDMTKLGKTRTYKRRGGPYDIATILSLVSFNRDKIDFDGVKVRMNSLRYHTFKRSCKCVQCGIEGEFFALEQDRYNAIKSPETFHFNLYALDEEGNEVLMTKDHIVPIAKGGKDNLDNLQTMCTFCNHEKGDTYSATMPSEDHK